MASFETAAKMQTSPLRPYVVALTAPLVVAGVMQLTWPFLLPNPASPYLLAVAIAAWYGGLTPALVSLAVSLLLADFFFIAPYFSWRGTGHGDWVRLIVVAFIGPVIGLMSELMHRERRRAETNLNNSKRAEQSLREAKERHESVLSSVADIHIVFDRQWHYIYVNDAAARAIGRTREQLRDHTLWEIYPDIIGTELDRQYRRAMDHRVAVAFDFYYATDDTWWENRFFPSPEGLAVFSTTITERKRAEEALRQAEQKYRDIFENAEEGIFQSTPEGQYVVANPALARMHGFDSPEQLISSRKDITREIYVNPELRQTFKKRLSDYGAIHQFEHQIFRKDGSKIWISVNARAVRNSAGEIIYYEGTSQDITQRKRAEEALRESEERYRELFENSKDALYVHDLSGCYASMNRAAEKLSGYSRAEVLGKHFSNFIALPDLKHVHENFWRKLRQKAETTYEIEIITKDKRRVPVEVISRLIYENNQPVGVQGTARDITERRLAQEAVRTYSQRLREAQETERQSIARELHDEIGQILTAVKINLHTLQNVCTGAICIPPIEESLTIVDAALDQVRELSLSLRPPLLDDLGLTAALRWYLDRHGQRTGVRTALVSDFDGQRLSRRLETACFRIAQEALTNIARHARATTATIRLERAGERLLLKIEDDGVGFDTQALNGHQALALGLRGMLERAEAIGGRLQIQSAPTEGTSVLAVFRLSTAQREHPRVCQ
ncbi:MAG TPA: PAS domain S-box protein [Pyrinomonadaceae bacterium]|nr:PAS domain S-box protein [Pyrinomonadaceae bacterium]